MFQSNPPVGVPIVWPWGAIAGVVCLAWIGVYLLWGGRFSRHAEGLFPFLAGFVVALRLSRPFEVPLWRFGCALVGANLALFLYFRIADLALWGIGLLLRFHASTRRGIVWVRRAVACFVICGWVALAAFGVKAPFARILAVVLAFPAAVTVVRWFQRGCARCREGYFQWVATRDPAGKVFRLFRAFQTGGVLVVLYGGYEAYLGSFRFENFTALFLFLQGVLLAHAFPRFGTILLASAWGAVFSTLPWRLVTHFWPVVVLMGGGLAWQASRRYDLEPIAGVRASWRGALAIGGGTSLIVLSLAGLLFFSLPPLSLSEVGAARWQRVRKALQGVEEKPYALVFGAANGRYLTGTPHLAGLLDIVQPEASGAEHLHWGFLRHGQLVGKALSAVRARKEPEEIARLERSAAIISRTFERIAPLIAPGKNEREIERAVLAEVLAEHGEGLSFPSIIASGRNAAFPHYMKNDAVMRDHLVVIDIGAMYQGYASDMTRTFPVSGTFSEREREIYEIVRNAQQAAIEACHAGVTFRELDRIARRVIEEAGYGDAYTHSLGHHVGLEVHDPHVEDLEEKMVITIEPGIYLPEESIGVRIEDTFVVEEKACRAITHFPTEPDAVEAAMRLDP